MSRTVENNRPIEDVQEAEYIKERFLSYLYEEEYTLEVVEKALILISDEVAEIKENVRLILQEEEDTKRLKEGLA